MAGNTKTFCSYCNSQHTQLDYALHRVSNAHVKKVQRNLVHRGFASACLVCNFALKDLKQAELHVQEKTHTDRMKSFLVDSYLSNDKCTCGSCGITFFNEVVLEAHRLSPLHDSTTSALHTTKLDELSRLLSGLCGKQFMMNCNRLCSICDVTFDCVEDSIMHLFTAAHISRLRSSSCMVCKKEFTHASDRELHINSSKHQIALRKCSNLLEEGRTQALLSKGGYPCMLCMLWCNSWFCLELHLLDKHHVEVSVQSKAKCPISARIVFSAVLEGIGQIAGCDESIMSSWREWRGDASGEHVWCHRCGHLLLNIDELNKHLDKHNIDRCLTTSRSHSSKVFDLDSVSEIFECSVCAVSFKNTFMLSVHEASFEHHSRLSALCLTNDVQCCSNCGLLMYYEGDGDGAFACKDMKGLLPQMNRVEVSPKGLRLLQHQSSACEKVKKKSNIRGLDTIMQATSSAKGTHPTSVVADKVCTDYIEAKSFLEADKRDNSLKVGMALGSGELSVSISDKTVRNGEGGDRVLIEDGLLMNQSFCTVNAHHDDNVSSQSGGPGHSLIPKDGCMSNIVVDGNGIVAGKSGTTMPSNVTANENDIESYKVHLIDTNRLLSEVSMPNVVVNSPTLHGHLRRACASLDDSFMQQNPVLFAGQVSDGNGNESAKKAKFPDIGVPIVVAATLAPLGTLQESLQSITTIVTESLSSALSAFYMQQSTSLLKRKSQSGVDEETVDQPEVKRLCSERILETALRQGLLSVGSNATTLNDLDVKCQGFAGKGNVRHTTGNDKDAHEPQAIVAVAASIIPNSLQDSSRPAGPQGQLEVSKAQESSAMQSGDDSNKRAQESTDVKSESLSQVVVGDRASAGSTGGKTVVEEKPNQLDNSHTLPSSALLCTGTQNVITSTPVSSLANGAISSRKDEAYLPAKKLTAPMGVNVPGVSEESESNDDDYYTFLDPTKGQGKWWSSSDSEDSDSVSK